MVADKLNSVSENDMRCIRMISDMISTSAYKSANVILI